MNKIANNYLYNLLYQVFVLLVPIVTAPYLARVLGPENQGISSYVVSVGNIISIITLLGIFGYGNRQVAYERDNKQLMSQTFWEIMFVRFMIAIVGSIVYFLLAFMLDEYTKFFLIYYIWIIATYLDCTWIYVGVEDMKPAVIKNFFAKLLTVAGIFIFVKDGQDLEKYIFLLGTSVLIANLLAYTQLRKYVVKPKIERKNLWPHLKRSVQLFLPFIATLVYLQIGKVMIEALTGETSQVSFYDNAEKIVTIPLTFITVLSTVMMPRIANEFSKGSMDLVQKLLNKAANVSLYLAFPMTFGLLVMSNHFVPWYLGREYNPVIFAIMFICPIILSNSLEGIAGKQYFTATNQINVLLKAYLPTALLNILINFILIPRLGFIGAAIATLVSSYLCVAIQFYYMEKQISMKSLIPKAIKYFGYSAMMAILLYFITRTMSSTPLTTFIQIILGASIYLGVSLLMKDELLMELISKAPTMLKAKKRVERGW